jgi:ABC-type Fe3+-hydroxamate transport system substrate-binding protein
MKEKILTSLFTLILIVVVQQEKQSEVSNNSTSEAVEPNININFKENQNNTIPLHQQDIVIVKYYENFYDFIKELS